MSIPFENKPPPCYVCGGGHKLPRSDDRIFVCGRCVNPQGAVRYCRNCKQRIRLSKAALAGMRTTHEPHGIPIPDSPGIILVYDTCPACDTVHPTLDFTLIQAVLEPSD